MNRHNKVPAFVFFLILSVTCSFKPSAIADVNSKTTHYDNNPIIAELDGRPIFLDDLKNAKIHTGFELSYSFLFGWNINFNSCGCGYRYGNSDSN